LNFLETEGKSLGTTVEEENERNTIFDRLKTRLGEINRIDRMNIK